MINSDVLFYANIAGALIIALVLLLIAVLVIERRSRARDKPIKPKPRLPMNWHGILARVKHMLGWFVPMTAYDRFLQSFVVPDHVRLQCEGDAALVYAYRSDINAVGAAWTRKSTMQEHFPWWDSANVWKSGSAAGTRMKYLVLGLVGVPAAMFFYSVLWAPIFPFLETYRWLWIAISFLWIAQPTWVFARDASQPYDIWPIRRRRVANAPLSDKKQIDKFYAALSNGEYVVEDEGLELAIIYRDELTNFANEHLEAGQTTTFIAETADGNTAREIADPEFFAKHGPFKMTLMKGLLIAAVVVAGLLVAWQVLSPGDPPAQPPTPTPTVEAGVSQ